MKTKHKIKTEKVVPEGYLSAANLQQASAQVYTLSSHFTPPNKKKIRKRPAVYSSPTGGVWQQLFGQSSFSSSFESMKQQALYKSKEMSRFDMLFNLSCLGTTSQLWYQLLMHWDFL